MVNHLIRAHGGTLVDLMVGPGRATELRADSLGWPSWDLTPRQLCDLELLLNGGFSPLRGFMGRADYESVRDRMRLADGTLWPIPVTLDVSQELATALRPDDWLSLRDEEGVMLAVPTTATCGIRPRSCASTSRSSAGAKSSRSRRATRSTARTSSSRCVRPRRSRRTC